MKKALLIFISAIAVINFLSCNDGSNKSAEQPKSIDTIAAKPASKVIILDRDCAGIANCLLEEGEAKGMIKRYETIYRKSGDVKFLGSSVWINELIISSFAAFLEKPEGKLYDGVRFMNIAKANNTDSRLLLVLTKPKEGNLEYHVNQWRNNIITLIRPDANDFFDYNKTLSQATPSMGNFETLYRGTKPNQLPSENMNPLSSSVWVNACIFSALKSVIDAVSDDPTNKIDGVRVYFGAYKDMSHNIKGQFHPNQSTIIIVPTNSDGTGGHTDNWDIIKKRTNYEQIMKDLAPKRDVFNHGELCPNKCDE